jgi:hypothetical protein
MLEDISVFINHITNHKPTSFKTYNALGFSLKKPGHDVAKRYTLPHCSEDHLRAILEQDKEQGLELEMMWRAFEADVYIPFDQFLDEALLPPPGHSGMLYDSQAMRYSLEGYVSVMFPTRSISDTFTVQLMTPQVLWEPTFKMIMQGVTDAMRQVSNLSSAKAYSL